MHNAVTSSIIQSTGFDDDVIYDNSTTPESAVVYFAADLAEAFGGLIDFISDEIPASLTRTLAPYPSAGSDLGVAIAELTRVLSNSYNVGQQDVILSFKTSLGSPTMGSRLESCEVNAGDHMFLFLPAGLNTVPMPEGTIIAALSLAAEVSHPVCKPRTKQVI